MTTGRLLAIITLRLLRGRKEGKGGRDGGRERGRKGGREGWREGGKDGGRERGREEGMLTIRRSAVRTIPTVFTTGLLATFISAAQHLFWRSLSGSTNLMY